MPILEENFFLNLSSEICDAELPDFTSIGAIYFFRYQKIDLHMILAIRLIFSRVEIEFMTVNFRKINYSTHKSREIQRYSQSIIEFLSANKNSLFWRSNITNNSNSNGFDSLSAKS